MSVSSTAYDWEFMALRNALLWGVGCVDDTGFCTPTTLTSVSPLVQTLPSAILHVCAFRPRQHHTQLPSPGTPGCWQERAQTFTQAELPSKILWPRRPSPHHSGTHSVRTAFGFTEQFALITASNLFVSFAEIKNGTFLCSSGVFRSSVFHICLHCVALLFQRHRAVKDTCAQWGLTSPLLTPKSFDWGRFFPQQISQLFFFDDFLNPPCPGPSLPFNRTKFRCFFSLSGSFRGCGRNSKQFGVGGRKNSAKLWALHPLGPHLQATFSGFGLWVPTLRGPTMTHTNEANWMARNGSTPQAADSRRNTTRGAS